MAKPKLKRVTRKRREKKLVERGAAHIRSSFNNTIVTITDTAGFRWRTWLPRQQEIYALCSTERRRNCRQGRDGIWLKDR